MLRDPHIASYVFDRRRPRATVLPGRLTAGRRVRLRIRVRPARRGRQLIRITVGGLPTATAVVTVR